MKNRIICVFAIFLVILTIILNKIGYEFGKYEGKKEGVFYAKVISEAEEKNYVYSYQAEIDNKKFILYIPKDVEKLEYGSIIKINAQYTEATRDRNYGGFNYKTYLRTKKIYGIFNVEDVEIVKNGSDNIIIKLRKYIKSKLREKLKKENSELAISLIVGDRSHISSEVEDNFKKANLMHMLAISGAHFSYVILIATFISNRLQHKRLGQLIQIIAIIFFMNLTGNTASVVRAGIMSILLIGSSICKRQNDSLNNIAISAIIQIINNPYIIFDSGFMLSYSGVLGIILFYKKISEHIHFKSIALTISANIFIIPIMIYNFHTN